MSETNVPDPWAAKPEVNIGGAPSMSSEWYTPGSNTLTVSSLDGFKIVVPKYVGHWEISGNFHVHVTERPNRLNRLMTRLLLGWVWNGA